MNGLVVRALAVVLALFVTNVAAQRPAQLAPFAELRWSADVPEARIADAWVEVRAIDGRSAAEILAFCRVTWPDKAKKRFTEDLVEVLTRMGRAPGTEVDLVLRDLESGIERTVRAAMTAENRRALRDGVTTVVRIAREHAREPDPRYADLAVPLLAIGDDVFARENAAQDLDQLESLVRIAFSYRDRTGVDVAAAFDTARLSIPEHTTRSSFALLLERLIARFGDGHAGVQGVESFLLLGCLPFLTADSSSGLVVFRADRSGFVDEHHPILTAMDGRPIVEWIDVAARCVIRGSPQLARHRALRRLRFTAQLRAEAGWEASDEVELELSSLDGARRTKRRVALAERKPMFGAWPRTKSRVLEGGIGYVRIEEMRDEPEFAREIAARIELLRDARAIVLDVRGNGGGSRGVLMTIAPWFVGDSDAPRVVNVAVPIASADSGLDALASRFLFPADHPAWSEPARTAIRSFAPGFLPEWSPKDVALGARRYLVLERGPDAPKRPFAGKIAVLQDGTCFSATEIFLAAFAELPNAILVGTPSGGGSGRAQSFVLANSRLVVELSSMISYRADGRLFDGRGVEPDFLVQPAPSDHVGRGDAVLDAALARLR